MVIRNNFIPFPGFKMINICGLIFARKNANISDIDLNHEKIHTAQILEMGIIFFYVWYVIEWVIKVFKYRSLHNAYRNVDFEKEAYKHESDLDYLKDRDPYKWFKEGNS